jgi:cytochrome c peroxidase
MKLFYAKTLSADQDTACVTCHHPMLGGGDAIPMSIGTGAHQPDLLGPDRSHPEGPQIPRNSPSTFNAAMWDQVMFWDGRIESRGKTPGKSGNDGYGIHTPDAMMFGYPDHNAGSTLAEAQARFPITSEEEMRGFDFGADQGVGARKLQDRTRELLAAMIGNYGDGEGALESNHWLAEFQAGFNSTENAETLITYEHIAKAIAAYENSQVFVDTPWKAYIEGDDNAISQSAKQGALLFWGKAQCDDCHTGDFFTDEKFHVLSVPQVGVGKDSGLLGDDDFGRYLETGESADKYAFRTPTLLNVEVTGPYGHDGAYATLEGIVRHHLNPAKAVETYDYSQLAPSIRTVNAAQYTQQALAQLQELRAKNNFTIQDIALTDEEVDSLVDFLLTLTDPCVKSRECLSPWIPNETQTDPDGMRLVAVDESGQPF